MDKIVDSIKLFIAWVLTVVAGLSLNQWAILLALVYSTLQITAFFYPWHKILWKKLGVKDIA